LLADLGCLLGWKRAAPPQDVGERLALDVLHDDVRAARVLAGVEDRHDVRVRQPGGQPRLPGEPPPQLVVAADARREQLDGHAPMQAALARAARSFTADCSGSWKAEGTRPMLAIVRCWRPPAVAAAPHASPAASCAATRSLAAARLCASACGSFGAAARWPA